MTLDYGGTIAEFNPSPDQIEEAVRFALEAITKEVREMHVDAVVLADEGLIHIVSEDDSSDLIFPMQYVFDAIFAAKIREIKSAI